MISRLEKRLPIFVWVGVVSILTSVGAHAQTQSKPLDLDGDGTAESQAELEVKTSPLPCALDKPCILDRVVNKSAGAFIFDWPSAGPGGFISSVIAGGSATPKTTQWQWQTSSSLITYNAVDFSISNRAVPFVSSYCTRECLDGVGQTAPNKGPAAGQITLNLTGGVTPYAIYRATDPRYITEPTSEVVSQTTSSTYTDTALPASGTVFFYRVRGTCPTTPINCTSSGDCGLATEGLCATSGPFAVLGRAFPAANPLPVTISQATLTANLVTFFSPEFLHYERRITASASGLLDESANFGTGDVTITTPAFPPDCCPASEDPHQTKCGGTCVHFLSDPNNCGGCGIGCGLDGCCVNGSCQQLLCGETLTDNCGNLCTNTDLDPANCGTCFHACGATECCVAGLCREEGCQVQAYPFPGTCPDSAPPPLELPDDAPVCVTGETTQVLHPGQKVESCISAGPLFREVPDSITACGDSIPGAPGECRNGTSGPFIRFVTAPTTPGHAYVTPYAARILSDTSNDGRIQPGETATIEVDVLNAGSLDITDAHATLSGPMVDLTLDHVDNPKGVSVAGGSPPSFGTIPPTPSAIDCVALTPQPVHNTPAYTITVDPDHPGNTTRPMVLSFTGTVEGDPPFRMDVPFSIGIGSRCDPMANSREFDGLDGLSSPMAKLVPANPGAMVPFPPNPFGAGQTRPLKLRLSCGGANLGDGAVDAPQIVGLSDATGTPLDIGLLNLNADSGTNPNDPFFRFNNNLTGGQWTYSMRTSLLGTGSFTLTIRIAGRTNFVTGFVLE